MLTRGECLDAAAREASDAIRVLYTYPLEEAARLAYHQGGPTIEELRERIAERRRAVGVIGRIPE